MARSDRQTEKPKTAKETNKNMSKTTPEKIQAKKSLQKAKLSLARKKTAKKKQETFTKIFDTNNLDQSDDFSDKFSNINFKPVQRRTRVNKKSESDFTLSEDGSKAGKKITKQSCRKGSAGNQSIKKDETVKKSELGKTPVLKLTKCDEGVNLESSVKNQDYDSGTDKLREKNSNDGKGNCDEKHIPVLDVINKSKQDIADVQPATVCPTCDKLIQGELQEHVLKCLKNRFERNSKNVADDAALAQQLQTREHEKVSEDLLTEQEFTHCQLCQKDLSHLNSQRRTQHVNRCMDKVEAETQQEKATAAALEKARTAVPNCPICGQHLKTVNSRKTHLKKCSASYKISTANLMELVKKQEEEIKFCLDAGVIPTDIRKPTKTSAAETKVKKGKKKTEPSSALDEDTQLAIALSKSLLEQQKEQQPIKLSDTTNAGPSTSKAADNQNTSMWPLVPYSEKNIKKKKRRGKKGDKVDQVPALLLTSHDNLQKKLAEKVATLFPQESNPVTCTPKFRESKMKIVTEEEENVRKKCLWSMSSHDLVTDEGVSEYYVTTLVPPLSPSKLAPGSKMKSLSQIPGRRTSNFPSSQEKQESDVLPLTQTAVVMAKLAVSAEEEEPSGYCTQKQPTSSAEVPGTLLKLQQDLGSMLDNPLASDVVVKSADRDIHGHVFVLAMRAPVLHQSIEKMQGTSVLDLSKWSESTVLAVLQYLYTGKVSLTEDIVSSVLQVANRYHIKDLAEECEHFLDENNIQNMNTITELSQELQKSQENKTHPSINNLMTNVWGDSSDSNSNHGDSHVNKDSNHSDSHDNRDEQEMDELYEFMATQRKRKPSKENKNESKNESSEGDMEAELEAFLKGSQSSESIDGGILHDKNDDDEDDEILSKSKSLSINQQLIQKLEMSFFGEEIQDISSAEEPDDSGTNECTNSTDDVEIADADEENDKDVKCDRNNDIEDIMDVDANSDELNDEKSVILENDEIVINSDSSDNELQEHTENTENKTSHTQSEKQSNCLESRVLYVSDSISEDDKASKILHTSEISKKDGTDSVNVIVKPTPRSPSRTVQKTPHMQKRQTCPKSSSSTRNSEFHTPGVNLSHTSANSSVFSTPDLFGPTQKQNASTPALDELTDLKSNLSKGRYSLGISPVNLHQIQNKKSKCSISEQDSLFLSPVDVLGPRKTFSLGFESGVKSKMAVLDTERMGSESLFSASDNADNEVALSQVTKSPGKRNEIVSSKTKASTCLSPKTNHKSCKSPGAIPNSNFNQNIMTADSPPGQKFSQKSGIGESPTFGVSTVALDADESDDDDDNVRTGVVDDTDVDVSDNDNDVDGGEIIISDLTGVADVDDIDDDNVVPDNADNDNDNDVDDNVHPIPSNVDEVFHIDDNDDICDHSNNDGNHSDNDSDFLPDLGDEVSDVSKGLTFSNQCDVSLIPDSPSKDDCFAVDDKDNFSIPSSQKRKRHTVSDSSDSSSTPGNTNKKMKRGFPPEGQGHLTEDGDINDGVIDLTGEEIHQALLQSPVGVEHSRGTRSSQKFPDQSPSVQSSSLLKNTTAVTDAEAEVLDSSPVKTSVSGADGDGDVWDDFDDGGYEDFDFGCLDGDIQSASPVFGGQEEHAELTSPPTFIMTPHSSSVRQGAHLDTSLSFTPEINHRDPMITPQQGDKCNAADKRIAGKHHPTIPSPFTPMPDYDTMVTPQLKREVQKFGVRALPKKKMKMLLKHVYEQTHQYETDTDCDMSFAEQQQTAGQKQSDIEVPKSSDRNQNSASKPEMKQTTGRANSRVKKINNANKTEGTSTFKAIKKSVKNSQQQETILESGLLQRLKGIMGKNKVSSALVDPEVSNSDAGSESDAELMRSSQSDSEGAREPILEESFLPEDTEDDVTPSQLHTSTLTLHQTLHNFIHSTEELHCKILEYEPLDLSHLQQLLTQANIKCSQNKLLDYLDEKCICFTMRNSRPQTQRRGRKKKVQKKDTQENP